MSIELADEDGVVAIVDGDDEDERIAVVLEAADAVVFDADAVVFELVVVEVDVDVISNVDIVVVAVVVVANVDGVGGGVTHARFVGHAAAQLGLATAVQF